MAIPFELFSLMQGMFLVIAVIGLVRNPQIPATLVIGGILMLVTSVLFMSIELGQLVDTATTSGSTTTFTYTPDEYEFNQYVTIIFALMGVIFMLVGVGMVFTEVKTS